MENLIIYIFLSLFVTTSLVCWVLFRGLRESQVKEKQIQSVKKHVSSFVSMTVLSIGFLVLCVYVFSEYMSKNNTLDQLVNSSFIGFTSSVKIPAYITAGFVVLYVLTLYAYHSGLVFGAARSLEKSPHNTLAFKVVLSVVVFVLWFLMVWLTSPVLSPRG